MTDLVHSPGHLRTGDVGVLSYLKDTGWTSRMTTPSPGVHLAGAATFCALGIWAGLAVGRHNIAAGVAVGWVAAGLSLMDLLPALWTLTHRQYAEPYLAARTRYGDGRARLHPLLVLVAMPALTALAAASTAAHQTAPGRTMWAAAGAAVGLALGLLRVGRARRA